MTSDQPTDGPAPVYNVCWPYFLGSDNPIPHLFEKIAPFITGEEFDITVFSDVRKPVVGSDSVTEVYAFSPHTVRRRVKVLVTLLQPYDLIHTGGNPGNQYPMARLGHLRNVGLDHVHTFRIDQYPDKTRLFRKKKYLVQKADAVTAVSEHTARTVKRTFGTRPHVIYNGVDSDLFKPEYDSPKLFESLGISGPVFLFVGSLESRKNPSTIIEVAERVTEAAFLIIGDGPRFDALKRASSDFSNVHLVGRLEKRHLPPIYANATGFLFPSVREGCPNVVLEAMASATPVVGYEATSMPELVTDGETGYLVPEGDVDCLVDRVRAVASEEGLGTNARNYVKENHSFEKIARQYRDVYRDVIIGG